MKKLFNKTAIAMTMAIVMVMSMVTSAFAARTFSDLNYSNGDPHWAKAVIEKWANTPVKDTVGRYYAEGYTNADAGKFKPDKIVTRAEFCAFANRFFGYFGKSKDLNAMDVTAPFSDVKVGKWYYHDVAVANAVGYCQGDGNLFRPEAPMSREEVAFALGKLFGLNLVYQVEGVAGTIDNTIGSVVKIAGLGVVDLTGVVPQLKPIVKVLLENKIISGVLDTVTGLISFVPNKAVSRAEIVQIMDNIFVQFPGLLNNGNLLTTVLGLVSGVTGTALNTVGGVVNTVTDLLDGLTGVGGAVAQDPTLATNPGAVTGVVGGLLGGLLGK